MQKLISKAGSHMESTLIGTVRKQSYSVKITGSDPFLHSGLCCSNIWLNNGLVRGSAVLRVRIILIRIRIQDLQKIPDPDRTLIRIRIQAKRIPTGSGSRLKGYRIRIQA